MNEQKANPQMITLAREFRGRLMADIAEELEISKSYLSRIEQEQSLLHPELLQRLSDVLDFPVAFFTQQGEILPPNLSYRKREKVPTKFLNQIEADINIYRLNIEKLFEQINYPLADIPKFNNNDAQTCAQKLRRLWEIPKGEINNLTKILEQQGILLLSFDFGTERIDGRSIFINKQHPVIFTNSLMLGDRQRFTLAYQLGHLVMHMHTLPSSSRDISHEANLFAAEFLMPEKDILKDFSEPLTLARLGELKRKWKVSMIALLFRAHDIAAISDNQKRYLLEHFNKLNIRRREPVETDIQKEKPVLFRSLLTRYKQKQGMSTKQTAAFFHLTEDEFLKRYN